MSGRGLSPQLQAMIATHRPHSVSEAAGVFAHDVVGRAQPQSPARAKALLFAASRLAAFGESIGLELRLEVLLCPAVIERFVLCGCGGLSPASVRTIRTNLRALSRALSRYPEPLPVALPRERVKVPYTPDQIEGYPRLAEAQSTKARRMRAAALICLGAGAGIVSGELRQVRGSEIFEAHGGLLVKLTGARARMVAVLSRYREPLIAAAAFAGDSLICGGRQAERRNITCALAGALSADPSLPRLQAGRLRSTWLAETAELIGLQAFMAAAGVSCSQRLGDIAARLPPPSEREMVALPRGCP